MKENRRSKATGFTLVEIMAVVTIIGLLASIAIPAYVQSRQNSVAAGMANDFRQYSESIQLHNLSSGSWPADTLPTQVPAGMEGTLGDSWEFETAIGGYWDYDYASFGFTAAVSVDAFTANEETVRSIDALLDDGNLATGRLRLVDDSHLSLILVD